MARLFIGLPTYVKEEDVVLREGLGWAGWRQGRTAETDGAFTLHMADTRRRNSPLKEPETQGKSAGGGEEEGKLSRPHHRGVWGGGGG